MRLTVLTVVVLFNVMPVLFSFLFLRLFSETGLLKRRGIERIFRFKICATGAVHKARVDCVVRPTINTSIHLTAGHEDRIRVLCKLSGHPDRSNPVFK